MVDKNKKVIGVAQVLEHLKNGMTRRDIANHYGITMSECKILFQDPRLKGKKTRKQPTFVVVDDENTTIIDGKKYIMGVDVVNEPD